LSEMKLASLQKVQHTSNLIVVGGTQRLGKA